MTNFADEYIFITQPQWVISNFWLTDVNTIYNIPEAVICDLKYSSLPISEIFVNSFVDLILCLFET